MGDYVKRNAVIESATMDRGSYGVLTAWVNMKIDNFGGYALYLPESFKHHEAHGYAGHFIFRVMEVAGVAIWDDLLGKAIRVHGNRSGIDGIGHIIKDDWFYPENDFHQIIKARKLKVTRK